MVEENSLEEGLVLCKTPLLFAVKGTQVRPIIEGENNEDHPSKFNSQGIRGQGIRTGGHP